MCLDRIAALAAFCLLAGGAFAVGNETVAPEAVIREKADRTRTGGTPQELLQREEARRARAEERAEKIRRLAPDQVPAWVASDHSDEALERLAAMPTESPPPALGGVPQTRMVRLGLAIVAVFVLGIAFRRYRNGQRGPTPVAPGRLDQD